MGEANLSWNGSVEQKIWIMMQVWAEVKFNFAFFNQVPELDWDQEVNDTLPRILAAKDINEYYQELQALLGKLNDGHTAILPPIEEMQSQEYPPLEVEMVADQVIVTRVGDSPEMLRQEISPGMEVLEVDGFPVREYLNDNMVRYYSGGTKQWGEAMGLMRLLKGPIDSTVQLKIKGKDGAIRDIELTRNSTTENGEVFRYQAEDFPPLVEKKEFGDIVYIKLASFRLDQIVDEFNKEFDQLDLDNLAGMIIDLRYNNGGSSDNGFKILSRLTDTPLKAAKWKTRKYLPAYRSWGVLEEWHEEDMGEIKPYPERNYTDPLVVLTGHNTVSAAEDFLVPLKFSGRAKVLGEISAGSTGNPLTLILPGGYILMVCTKVDMYPDGEEFVGVGIEPDIPVSRCLDDVIEGRDPVLEKALDVLRNWDIR